MPGRGLDAMIESDLIKILQRRGYVVRHKGEAKRALSWSRTAPFPPGVDFKAEALTRLREQIVPEMIDFRTDAGSEFSPEIHRAILRVLY